MQATPKQGMKSLLFECCLFYMPKKGEATWISIKAWYHLFWKRWGKGKCVKRHALYDAAAFYLEG